jgi:hypothetical protein
MRGFMECGMGILWQDHFRMCDARFFNSRFVSRRFDRQHNGFRSAARQMTDRIGIAAQQIDNHSRDIGFQFQDGRKDRGVESVFAQER